MDFRELWQKVEQWKRPAPRVRGSLREYVLPGGLMGKRQCVKCKRGFGTVLRRGEWFCPKCG